MLPLHQVPFSHDSMPCRCRCQPAFAGSKYCDTPFCAHGGTVALDGQSCDCPFPWTGGTCLEDLCINGVANFQTNQCDCLFGWTGARCDQNSCEHGGKPNYLTGACSCPAKWGGPTCSFIVCRTNNFWDEALQRCVCQPGWKGALCDVPDCNNNKLPDAAGNCACARAGEVNQYMDNRCTYRWCGPAGNRVCIGGACICICDDRRGVYLDPVTGNCTLPVCGTHATYSVALGTCVCDAGYTKDTSVPLQPCVRDCGANGVYNSIAGACTCLNNRFGANCEFDTVAFVQRLVTTQAIVLPNGIVVSPTDTYAGEVQIGDPAPTARVQVVLFDPLPDPISYQEDAENAIRNSIPGYTILWTDVNDLVQTQSGLPTASGPESVVISTTTVQVDAFDGSLSFGYYVTSVAIISTIVIGGIVIFATNAIAITQNALRV